MSQETASSTGLVQVENDNDHLGRWRDHYLYGTLLTVQTFMA